MTVVLQIAVFGSSQPQPGSVFYEEAFRIGYVLAEAGWTVVNGGYDGTMEASAKGAKEAGGKTLAVTVGSFRKSGILANPFIDSEIVVDTYGDRLAMLTRIADGYVVLRGGSGTLTELFLSWELVKNGSLPPRPIILFGKTWPRIMDFLGQELADETAFRNFRHLLMFADVPAQVVKIIKGYYG